MRPALTREGARLSLLGCLRFRRVVAILAAEDAPGDIFNGQPSLFQACPVPEPHLVRDWDDLALGKLFQNPGRKFSRRGHAPQNNALSGFAIRLAFFKVRFCTRFNIRGSGDGSRGGLR